jgi:hypothetical protein
LAGDLVPGVAGAKQGDALEVFVVAESAERGSGGRFLWTPFIAMAPSAIIVMKKPWQMALTVMPCCPHSAAKVRVKTLDLVQPSDAEPGLKVVTSQGADPDHFLAHYRGSREAASTCRVGATGRRRCGSRLARSIS